MSGGHFDDGAAPCAHRVMVRIVGQAVSGNPALEDQRVQHTLVEQGGHRAVDRRQVRWLVFGWQTLAQPLVDLGNGQMRVAGSSTAKTAIREAIRRSPWARSSSPIRSMTAGSKAEGLATPSSITQ